MTEGGARIKDSKACLLRLGGVGLGLGHNERDGIQNRVQFGLRLAEPSVGGRLVRRLRRITHLYGTDGWI